MFGHLVKGSSRLPRQLTASHPPTQLVVLMVLYKMECASYIRALTFINYPVLSKCTIPILPMEKLILCEFHIPF